MPTISNKLKLATENLKDFSSTPRLDAELILAFVLNTSRQKLLIDNHKTLSQTQQETFDQAIHKRQEYFPVAYITGVKEFWGLDFEVNPDVLIPRPDTECLVENALKLLERIKLDRAIKIADLGTGSGAIAIALAHELKQKNKTFKIDCIDLSSKALGMARKNANRHQVQANLDFYVQDFLSDLPNKYDLILSNPPYIAQNDPNLSPETKWEPQSALFSRGQFGEELVFRLIESLDQRLEANGIFLCEIGKGQSEILRPKLVKIGLNFEFFKDLAGIERVLMINSNVLTKI